MSGKQFWNGRWWGEVVQRDADFPDSYIIIPVELYFEGDDGYGTPRDQDGRKVMLSLDVKQAQRMVGKLNRMIEALDNSTSGSVA